MLFPCDKLGVHSALHRQSAGLVIASEIESANYHLNIGQKRQLEVWNNLYVMRLF